MAPTSRATSISFAPKRLARPRRSPRRNRKWFPRQHRTHPQWRPEPVITSARSAVSNPVSLGTRHSHGLDQFCASLEERPGLSILDLAGANQATVSFLTNYGHRLFSDDFVHQMDDCFGDGDFYANQSNPLMSGKFLDAALGFSDGIFDGVLVWDTLQFLSTPLLQTVVSKLYRVLRPGSAMLAFFHAE